MSNKEFIKRVFHLCSKYFFRGLLIVLPIAATIGAVVWVYQKIDGSLQNWELSVSPWTIFVLAVIAIAALGYFASGYFIKQVLSLFGEIFERTPGIKVVYSIVKDFLEAFVGEKKKFTEAVLVQITDNGILRIGFITKKDLSVLGLSDHVGVYFPDSYAVSGVFNIVPASKVQKLENVNSGEIMKMVLTGGLGDVGKDKEPSWFLKKFQHEE